MAHLEEIRATFERNPGHLAVADIRWLIEEAEMTRSRTKSDLAADILVLRTALQNLAEPHTRNERDGECDWDGHPWPCPTMKVITPALAAGVEGEPT